MSNMLACCMPTTSAAWMHRQCCSTLQLTPPVLLAAACPQLNMPDDEVAETIRSFRKAHIRELTELAALSGSSLGYGSRGNGKQTDRVEDEDEEEEEEGMPALPASA